MHRLLDRPVDLLLVEDNPADSMLFEEGMREAVGNCRVTIAGTGREAMDVLFRLGVHEHASRPDLILLDLNLPGLHGHDVLEAIKADASLRFIPVIVLTSSRAPGDVMKSYALGASSYLQKPIGLEENFQLARSIRDYWFNFTLLPPAPGIGAGS